jgi:hydrophobic/amphiphilic exporter-1 (mainly G- bacteria), HAE1 family
MSLPRFSVKNHVLVNMMMLVILVGGTVFAFTLVKEMFPESRPNRLSITAVYPGVQPQEIEKAITIKVEEAVRDVDGIEKVDSTVQEGFSTTSLTLYNEVKDVDVILQEVQANLDALEDLPDDLEKITVRKMVPRLPVISVAIYGDGTEARLKKSANALRDELLLLPGVTDVEITGIRDDEISVEIRPDRLLKYNITFNEVAVAIRETNIDVSGGQLKGDRSSIAIRTLGEKLRGRDLENIVVRSRPDGSKIYVRDVAIVKDTFVESDLESYFNGKRGVNCTVYKSGSQDAVEIAMLVRAYIAGKQNVAFDPYGISAAYKEPWYKKPFAIIGSRMSWGVGTVTAKMSGKPDPLTVYENSKSAPFDHNFKVALHTDLARFIEGRLDLMIRNGKSGLVLVVISLMLFLNWRVAFWAAVGLPISFLGTFIVMWALGATINLLSLFGLIIVLGIIVDDAIVIGENIYRYVEEGMPPHLAAVKGAEEVMWPVTIAVLTTIAAFAPLFFIHGQIGDFMGQLPIVVLAALSVSLIEALMILPAHLAHLPSKEETEQKEREKRSYSGRKEGQEKFVERFRKFQQRLGVDRVAGLYERFLRLALRWRYVTISVAVGLFIATCGLLAGGVVERVFIQKMDSETLLCSLEMPVGTTSDQVKKRLAELVKQANSMPEVVNVQAFVARQYDLTGAGTTPSNDQSHLGQLVIELKPADLRERDYERSSLELLTAFRKTSQQLDGVNAVTWQAMNGGPGGKNIHIRVVGKNFKELVTVSEKLKASLKTYKGVYDLDDDVDRGKREVQLELRAGARETGISVGALGAHVRSAVFGREARRLTRNREDVRIMVRYPKAARKTVHDLESMWVPTSVNSQDRQWTPLRNIARLSETNTYSTIHRSQQRHSVSVFGEVDEDGGANTTAILAKIRKNFDEEIQKKHPDVRIEFLGSVEERMKAFGGLKLAFPVAFLMIYMLLAGLFRSYMQPIVVMAAIPFGFLGAVVGHWVTGHPMTILSWIGLVALTGIVVNDSLVLVSFINDRVKKGVPDFEASIQGAKLRLRAILLTTLTTVAGLTPLMFETSFQAKFLIPMAVTLTFGLAFATGLTLVIVPTLNMIFFDIRGLFRRRKNEKLQEAIDEDFSDETKSFPDHDLSTSVSE